MILKQHKHRHKKRMSVANVDVCDVWLDLLDEFQNHSACTFDQLNKDNRFLNHAVAMMKDFGDLVIGALEVPGITIDRVLAFTEVLFDDHLFRTLVDNLRHLPKEQKQKQAGIFLLIFEVCEWRALFYEKFKSQLSTDMDQSTFVAKLDRSIAENRSLRDKYRRVLDREFHSLTHVRDVADEMFTKWKARSG